MFEQGYPHYLLDKRVRPVSHASQISLVLHCEQFAVEHWMQGFIPSEVPFSQKEQVLFSRPKSMLQLRQSVGRGPLQLKQLGSQSWHVNVEGDENWLVLHWTQILFRRPIPVLQEVHYPPVILQVKQEAWQLWQRPMPDDEKKSSLQGEQVPLTGYYPGWQAVHSPVVESQSAQSVQF